MEESLPPAAAEEPLTQPRQALVLSGGDVKGAYQAGAIAEVLQNPDFRPSAIYGISVGSINGGMLASYVGKQFRTVPPPAAADFAAAAKEVEAFWLENIHGVEDIAEPLKLWRIGWDVLRHKFRGFLDVSESIQIIRNEIDSDYVQAASDHGLNFYPGTLNLTRACYFDGTSDSQPPMVNYKDIVDYVIASAMAPIIMPLWVIPSDRDAGKSVFVRWRENRRERRARRKPDHVDRDDSWLDGGIYYPAPISAAIEDGFNDLICVLTRPKNLGRGSFQGRLGALGARVTDVVTQKLLDVDMQWAQDMQAWLDFIEQKVTLSKEEYDRFTETRFGNYRSFQITAIRPDPELQYKIEELKEGDVPKMVERGHQDARLVMSTYKRHVPKPFAKS